MVDLVPAHSGGRGKPAVGAPRAPERAVRRNRLFFLLLIFILALAVPASSPADPSKAEVTVDLSGGYARLVFVIDDDVDASVQTAGNVLIVSFSKPVPEVVERLPAQAPDYIGAARRDPDGRAVRLGLARPVKVNSIRAADKFFVDLLPDTWSGPPPPLPQNVVEELARRAREAERLERLERQNEQHKKLAPVRVHVATQPTFVRYVFDIPDQTAVTADRAKERLTLTFDTPIVFDLADAEAELPPAVAAIHAELEQDSAIVRFSFLSKVDVRTFRDGNSYVVDVATDQSKPDVQGEGEPKPVPNVAVETGPPAKPNPEKPNADSGAAQAVEAAAAVLAGKPNATPPAAIAAPAPLAAQVPPAAAAATPEPKPPAPAPKAAAPHADAPSAAAQVRPAAPSAAAQPTPPAPAPNAAAPHADAPSAAPSAAAAPKPAASAPNAAAPHADAPSAAQNAPIATAPAGKTEAQAAPPKPAQPAGAAPGAAASGRATPPARGKEDDTVTVGLSQQGADLKLSFPFTTPTAVAVFQRADTLWIVFDSKLSLDLSALDGEPSRTIRGTDFVHAADADVVRIRLDHPHLSSLVTDRPGWTVIIGDTVVDPTRALDLARNMIGPNRASAAINFTEPHQLHRIHDPEVGDDLLVITGFAPARGFVNEQDFIEFHMLASTQGVVVEPIADDVNVELAADKVVVSRPGGLTLSSSLQSVLRGSALHSVMFDAQLWGLDRQSSYNDRQSHLLAAAAAAPATKRLVPRLDLARFYIARELYPEAKGVLDTALADQHSVAGDPSAYVLRAVTEVMMNRPEAALKDLANPAVGDQHDAPLWRALAFACEGKWAQARDNFKTIEAAIATLPIELQRVALKDEMRAAIEVGDFASAADQLNDLETIGLPRDLQPAMSVLIGRLSEGMGRSEDALTAYRTAADSWDRPAAAQGRLREAALRYALGDLKRDDAISQLETLTTVWRGDETEVEALQMLARLYTQEGRYRDSFYVMRTAIMAHPNSDMTRRIQEEAAATFDSLFLSDRGDAMPAVDALALFYDFRELTPIGRRGDELIRRLADRLVSVDLLDQAAELLQYQVDHRLQGAARAQVATRLAVIYLMNRKPDRALATLRATSTADLANEMRNQRLLLEARALSDLGRHDLALEVVANIEGREVTRLRSDILWAARRWAKSAEQIELYYGDRWKQWQPLNDVERSDILRAAVGYALGEDSLGLSRFREKYAAKMAQTSDARDFEIVSAQLGTDGAEFRAIARAAASVDTLEGFLRDMQARYPDASASRAPQAGAPSVTPADAGTAPASSTAPDTHAAAPAADPMPAPPTRAAGRSARR
jgi:tetratricopeptide (TPR) repeat protein